MLVAGAAAAAPKLNVGAAAGAGWPNANGVPADDDGAPKGLAAGSAGLDAPNWNAAGAGAAGAGAEVEAGVGLPKVNGELAAAGAALG